jgi:hypothetical protein
MKYAYDYSKCITEHFGVPTYHKYFNIPKGIQSIALEHNNKSDFPQRFEQFVEKTKLRKPRVNITDDNTIAIVYLLDNIKYAPEFQDEAYCLYGKYNSKSCVSITLVELDNILSGNTHDINHLFKNDPNKRILDSIWKYVQDNGYMKYYEQN